MLGKSTANSISFIHFWQAALGVCSAKRRHHSPEWMILSHISCFIQGEVIGFQFVMDHVHPRSMRASWQSPPVLQVQAVKILASVPSCIGTVWPNREKQCLDNNWKIWLPGCLSHIILHMVVPFDS